MKIYGLIGHPLTHSYSEDYFNRFFRQEKIPAVFQNFPLTPITQIYTLLRQIPELQGLAVTHPYKKSILSYLDWASPEVQQTGACNCIDIRERKLYGFNTDIIGFEKSFLQAYTGDERKAIILGNGGAAAAARFVLQKNGFSFLIVTRKKNTELPCIRYEELNEEIIRTHPVIINATPVGQFPAILEAPAIPYNFITSRHFLFDMIYNPAMTTFLRNGAAKGATILNGREMLEIQAKENWKIWSV